jgi:hypothetical protein
VDRDPASAWDRPAPQPAPVSHRRSTPRGHMHPIIQHVWTPEARARKVLKAELMLGVGDVRPEPHAPIAHLCERLSELLARETGTGEWWPRGAFKLHHAPQHSRGILCAEQKIGNQFTAQTRAVETPCPSTGW